MLLVTQDGQRRGRQGTEADDCRFRTGVCKVSHTIFSVTALFQLDLGTVVSRPRKGIVKEDFISTSTHYGRLYNGHGWTATGRPLNYWKLCTDIFPAF